MALHVMEDGATARLPERKDVETIAADLGAPPVFGRPVASSANFARSLSHELRTPMQGVVGMLDIMRANIQDALETLPQSQVTEVLQSLMDNIEVVQGQTSPVANPISYMLTDLQTVRGELSRPPTTLYMPTS